MNTEAIKQGFQQAAALFQAQQYDQALQILDRLDNAVPNTRDILYFKARVLGVLNRAQEAATLCDRLTALGDARGEQLKAALAVVPSGPPPVPSTGSDGTAGPPPLLPDQDMTPSYAMPPQFGSARRSKKMMNIVGFGLMGALLLAAVIVVIVRGGDGGKDGATPPKPQPPEGHMASASGEATPSAVTPTPPDEAPSESPETEGAAPKAGAASEAPEPTGAADAAETSPEPAATAEPAPAAPGVGESVESLAARLQQMDPAEQFKTMSEMDTAQLAELIKVQSKALVDAMAQQAATPEDQQAVAQMRQELENTDFQEAARMTKEMMAQADPQALAQMGISPLESSAQPKESYTDEIMRGFHFDNDEDAGQAEAGDTGAAEQAPGDATIEESTENAVPETPEPVPDAPVRPIFGNVLARTLEFPKDVNLGVVYLRKTGALEREPWERAADARGKLGIPPGYDVKLQIQTRKLEYLEKFGPDDIQVLSLWSVKIDDKKLEPIKRLTGLKELDIRQTDVTMEGWEALRKALPECRILY